MSIYIHHIGWPAVPYLKPNESCITPDNITTFSFFQSQPKHPATVLNLSQSTARQPSLVPPTQVYEKKAKKSILPRALALKCPRRAGHIRRTSQNCKSNSTANSTTTTRIPLRPPLFSKNFFAGKMARARRPVTSRIHPSPRGLCARARGG